MYVKVLNEEVYAQELTHGFSPVHTGDAGVDLRSAEDVTVHAGETIAVKLGVALAVPFGHVGWLTGRSTTALKMGLMVHEGKIDSGYRGEIHCFCTATGAPVPIKKGDRICQLILLKIAQYPASFVYIPTDEEWAAMNTTRGEDGLGSTGLR